jgi:hypothetical protein
MFRLSLIQLLAITGNIVLVLVICVLVPYTFTVIPECSVLVTNAAGKPIDNAEVYETGIYGDFGRSWAEKKVTDREGRVIFPARIIRTSLMQRALARLFIKHFMHLPAGRSGGLVSVCDEGRYAEHDISPRKSDGNIHFVLVAGPCGGS